MTQTRTPTATYKAKIPIASAGQRLDVVAAQLFPDFSRARLTAWIKAEQLLVNGQSVKPNAKVAGGETLLLAAEASPQGRWHAEALPLAVVYEDAELLVVNKPAGLVVHPAAGNYSGTLLNGLLHHLPQLIEIPRAGIVHRLDKDTTGLMVVAKTLRAQAHLVAQLQARSVKRDYVALVYGTPPATGEVRAAIGRDPHKRKQMAAVPGGKEAVTEYRVLRKLGPVTWLALALQTGRTHQIRVHMTHLGYPLVGDPLYGRKKLASKDASEALCAAIKSFTRQALHARALTFTHPATGDTLSFNAPVPADLQQLLGIAGL